MEKIAATTNSLNSPPTRNRAAESHVYEPQLWFYLRQDPPPVAPCVVNGFRVMHDTSMCKPYGLFRIFNAEGAEVLRQLSHP